MQRIELEAIIDENRQLHVDVPKDWPIGQTVKVVVQQLESTAAKPRVFGQFKDKVHISADFKKHTGSGLVICARTGSGLTLQQI